MSRRPVIDAGPSLNFFSINKERLLISVLGPLSAPETVRAEVLRKSREDVRFRSAATVWRKLTPRWLEILSDDETPELAAVVHRITQQPMRERLRHPRDLGEIMVVAHAVVAAEAGGTTAVLIDDGAGARIATSELSRLQRLRAQGRPVGSIRLVSTLTVLERAAGSEHVPDKTTMRDIYQRLRGLDDGLPPVETTNLLVSPFWDRGNSERS
ncbi:PIN domain-containing protein [Plantactinospora endophytica]|uniref:PIN domain-containing protein n=1 Tax=Plantactinospora endophytica TaxID=673535 RepID=A0ABQ4DRK1_9ACTN|nr:hypothetical protein [Plantactinospora endophytica]GIG85079.1 hypothetical protein Pen02_00150 [Plantactinospora endophytica]